MTTVLNKEAIRSTWGNMVRNWRKNFTALRQTKRYQSFTRQIKKRMELKNELIILKSDGTVTFEKR